MELEQVSVQEAFMKPDSTINAAAKDQEEQLQGPITIILI